MFIMINKQHDNTVTAMKLYMLIAKLSQIRNLVVVVSHGFLDDLLSVSNVMS